MQKTQHELKRYLAAKFHQVAKLNGKYQQQNLSGTTLLNLLLFNPDLLAPMMIDPDEH